MMMHPSYKEMISKINEGQDMDEAPLVTSRYSIVIAASKRARQLVDGDEALIEADEKEKPLSTAVRELYEGKVNILPADAPSEEVLEKEEEDRFNEENGEDAFLDDELIEEDDDEAEPEETETEPE